MRQVVTLAMLALIIATSAKAQMYHLEWLCVSSGGSEKLSSDSYSAMLTCAQPVAGKCEWGSYGVYFGFWHPLMSHALDVELIESEVLPEAFELQQNYPNPFNPSTTINFSIPRAGQVTLAVYNILGQLVTVLADQYLGAGDYRVTWDGRDCSGNESASGIYMYKLQAGSHVETKKMLLMK